MKILYFGTYEKQYSRNVRIIALLKSRGNTVVEWHRPVLESMKHKHGLMRSPLALVQAAWMLGMAYARLIPKLCFCARSFDELWIGYIGHLDILFAYPIAKMWRLPIVFNPMISLYDTVVEDRGLFRKTSIPSRLLWMLDFLAFHAAERIIIDSEGQKRYLFEEFRIPLHRIEVIPFEADACFRPLPPDKEKVEDHAFTVLFFGKISPMHGLDRILQAMKLIQDRNLKGIYLKIAGDGQHVEELRSLAQSLKLSNVQWLGWVERDELPLLINQADVCLGIFGTSAKARRVIPFKVWEALACGKRVVTQILNPYDAPLLPKSAVQVEPLPETIAAAIVEEYKAGRSHRA
jgi:glycosyltransferase involved in cell wall biosynthesis